MADEQRSDIRETILAMFGWQPDALAFDSLDYETWPQRLRDLAGEVEDGMDNGDLAPLASYLRAGYPLPIWLSLKLAAAIELEGDGRYLVEARGRKKGEQGEKAAADRYARNANIGAYVAFYLHKYGQSSGIYDSAIADARTKFGLGEKSSAPAQHYAAWRDRAFQKDGSIHPFYAVFFSDRYWENYFSNRFD